MKKFLSLILAILMVVTTIPMAFAADVVASGTFGVDGDNLTWVLDSDCVLTISGEGAMSEEGDSFFIAPWESYKNSISTVIIENGVTTVGCNAFYSYNKLRTIVIADSVKRLESASFMDCKGVEMLIMGSGIEYFGMCSFWDTGATVHYSGTAAQFNSAMDDYNGKPSGQIHYVSVGPETPDGYKYTMHCDTCGKEFTGPKAPEIVGNFQNALKVIFKEAYTMRLGSKYEYGYNYGSGETADYAFDCDSMTKLCLVKNNGSFFDGVDTYVVIVETLDGTEAAISGYEFITANDSPGRDPDDWKLYGSDNMTEWELIDEVADAQIIDERETEVSFKLDEGSDAYRYFKFEFTGIKEYTNVFQIAEILLINSHKHLGGEQTCKGYLCECGEWYGEKNDNHDWSNKDGLCVVCKYECAHNWGEGVLTRPTKTEEGYYTYTCSICQDTKTEPVERAANYDEFYALLEQLRSFLNEDLLDGAREELETALKALDRDIIYKYIKGEENIVDEMNALVAEMITNAEAAIESGKPIKADYTEIDEAIAEIEKKLADENVTDEAKAEFEEIKAQLEEMKQNPNASKADLAALELDKALDEYEAKVDAGIADGTAVKADYTEIDEAIAEIEQKLADKDVTDEEKAELEEIKSQLEEMKADGNTSAADIAELEKTVNEFNAGIIVTCPDCGRDVHGDTWVENLVCWLVMLFNLIKTMF